jgi:hypothetical protein
MKKNLIAIVFTLLSVTGFSQISNENTINGAMYSVELEDDGYKYYVVDYENNKCIIYNTDYSSFVTIDIALPSTFWLYDLAYVSTKVFDTDAGVELVAVFQKYIATSDTEGYYEYQSRVINENGTILLDVPQGGYTSVITNGENDNKFLVYVYDYSTSPLQVSTNIYSIPGYPVSVTEEMLMPEIQNAFPNPSQGTINIPYEVDETNSWMIIKNANGIEMAKHRLDANAGKLILDVSAYAKGIYFYNLQSGKNTSRSGKFIVQ